MASSSSPGGVLREMAGQTEDSEEITVVERRLRCWCGRRPLVNARIADVAADQRRIPAWPSRR